MKARVKQSSRYGIITAFTGREYVKYEWRLVPDGCEDEAAKHPFLTVDSNEDMNPEKQEQPSLEEVRGVGPKKKTTRRSVKNENAS